MSVQRISQVTLETIKDAANEEIDLVLTELGIDIDNSIGFADELRCACPVHGGDNPTGFSYSTTFKRWRCFTGRCHEDRDSIFGLVGAILSQRDNREVGFRESVFWLAKLLNIQIEGEAQIDENKLELHKLTQQAKFKQRVHKRVEQRNQREKFEPVLVSSIQGKIKPSQYFLDLGFSEEILRKYNVGYCDDSRKPMYLRSYAPVLDESGEYMIGVTGRIKYEECESCGDYHEDSSRGCPRDNPMVRAYPKWIHYGFNSNSVLYNSWNAARVINDTGIAILLEGPKDVWWMEQHGIHNSVCIFGLNVFDYHVSKLIKMGATTIVVALDNDERGIEAAERLEESLGMYFKLVNINYLLGDGEDIADVDSTRMKNVIIPFLKSLENNNGK
jgi:DNA primase